MVLLVHLRGKPRKASERRIASRHMSVDQRKNQVLMRADARGVGGVDGTFVASKHRLAAKTKLANRVGVGVCETPDRMIWIAVEHSASGRWRRPNSDRWMVFRD